MKFRSRRTGLSRLLALQSWGFRGTSLIFVVTGFMFYALSAFNPATLQGARSATSDLLAPVIATINRPVQLASEFVGRVSGIAQLQDEVVKLRQENARLREWHNAALTLQAENIRLSKMLNLKVPEPHHFISARVISDAGNTFARSLLILAGEPDGVKKGQAVISGDGLVGRVIDAGDKASRILLLTDINSRVPVMIEGGDSRAILAGQNHEFPMLDHLPPDHGVVNGQRVVTSGHGGLFLPGLPVGLTYVDPQGRVYVRMFADIERMAYVRMIDRVVDEAVLKGQIKPVPAAN